MYMLVLGLLALFFGPEATNIWKLYLQLITASQEGEPLTTRSYSVQVRLQAELANRTGNNLVATGDNEIQVYIHLYGYYIPTKRTFGVTKLLLKNPNQEHTINSYLAL